MPHQRHIFFLFLILLLAGTRYLDAQSTTPEVYVDEIYNYAWQIPMGAQVEAKSPATPTRFYFEEDGTFIGMDDGILTPQSRSYGYGRRPKEQEENFFYGSIIRNDFAGRYTYVNAQSTLSLDQVIAANTSDEGPPQVVELPSATFVIPQGQEQQVVEWGRDTTTFRNFYFTMLADGHYFGIPINRFGIVSLRERLQRMQEMGQDTEDFERVIASHQLRSLSEMLLDFEYNGHRYAFEFNEEGGLADIVELEGQWTTKKTTAELASAFTAAQPADFIRGPEIWIGAQPQVELPLFPFEVKEHGVELELPVHPSDLRFGPWTAMDQVLYFDLLTNKYAGMRQQGWSTKREDIGAIQEVPGRFRRVLYVDDKQKGDESRSVLARVAHFKSKDWSLDRIDTLLRSMIVPTGLSKDSEPPVIIVEDFGAFQVYAQDRLGIASRETTFYPCSHTMAIRQGDWLHLFTLARPYRGQILSILNAITFQGYQLHFTIDETFHIESITAEQVTDYQPLNEDALELLRTFRQDVKETISSVAPSDIAKQELKDEFFFTEDDVIRLPQLARIKLSRTTNGLDEFERGVTLGFVFTQSSPDLFKVDLDESVCTLTDNLGNDLFHAHDTFLEDYRRRNPELLSSIYTQKAGWDLSVMSRPWEFEQYVSLNTLGMPAPESNSVELNCELVYKFRQAELGETTFSAFFLTDQPIYIPSDDGQLRLKLRYAGSGGNGETRFTIYHCDSDLPLESLRAFSSSGTLIAEMDEEGRLDLPVDENNKPPSSLHLEVSYAKARTVKVPLKREIELFIPLNQKD